VPGPGSGSDAFYRGLELRGGAPLSCDGFFQSLQVGFHFPNLGDDTQSHVVRHGGETAACCLDVLLKRLNLCGVHLHPCLFVGLFQLGQIAIYNLLGEHSLLQP